ncbi:hypothetical protein QTP70_019807, partial [Hemibagrus guttatus]
CLFGSETVFSFCFSESADNSEKNQANLRREGYTLKVNVNDYLDIYCPHYNVSQRGVAEQYVLYMVSYRGYRTCDPQLGFKRWECNRPHAPHAPYQILREVSALQRLLSRLRVPRGPRVLLHLAEQIVLCTATPTHHHGRSCLRLRVYVCCSTAADAEDEAQPTEPDYTLRPNMKIDDLDDYDNPEVPKLEKSISGSSPSRDHLLLTVATLFLIALSIS